MSRCLVQHLNLAEGSRLKSKCVLEESKDKLAAEGFCPFMFPGHARLYSPGDPSLFEVVPASSTCQSHSVDPSDPCAMAGGRQSDRLVTGHSLSNLHSKNVTWVCCLPSLEDNTTQLRSAACNWQFVPFEGSAREDYMNNIRIAKHNGSSWASRQGFTDLVGWASSEVNAFW